MGTVLNKRCVICTVDAHWQCLSPFVAASQIPGVELLVSDSQLMYEERMSSVADCPWLSVVLQVLFRAMMLLVRQQEQHLII